MIVKESFEATYPQYPFAPLVSAGVAFATLLAGRKQRGGAAKDAAAGFGQSLGSAASS